MQRRPFLRTLAVRSAAVLAFASIAPLAAAADILGAGATFPAPIYARWADAYLKATGNKLNYQSIGSGGGIKQIVAKTVDFGASDMPLKPADLDKDGLMQFPTVIGGVVPVVNLSGVKGGELRLTGAVLADIYLGRIQRWNDKAIAELNPKVNLPAQEIAVVRRADGSGTSFIFTSYLSKVSADWARQVGEGTAPQWPVGLGGKGNEGVSAFVQRIPAAIGYVEYAYARQNHMTWVMLQNREGQWVAPDDDTFKAAAAGADWTRSAFAEILTDMPGKASWPITGATFILMHKAQARPERAAEVLKFFDWSYRNGSAMASELEYVPLPESLVALIRRSFGDIRDTAGKPVLQR
jgi:phosphate transport system substrate-binding protein